MRERSSSVPGATDDLVDGDAQAGDRHRLDLRPRPEDLLAGVAAGAGFGVHGHRAAGTIVI